MLCYEKWSGSYVWPIFSALFQGEKGTAQSSLLPSVFFCFFFPQVCNPGEGGKGVSMSMTNVHSQTNGQQSQGCTVTPSVSKHGSIGLEDLSGGSKKRSGAGGGGGGGKDTMTQSSDSSLPDCSTATSVLSQPWGARSPTAGAEEKAGEERAGVSSPTAATGSLAKPKRKPAPSKPGSACSNPSAAPDNIPTSTPRPPSSSSSASPALPPPPPLENPPTNRKNKYAPPNQTPPPFAPSSFSSPLATPSPVPSIRFRETPILRRAPRASSSASATASAKYQTLPVEEGGRSRARRRYSLSEGGSSKTYSSHQGGGGAPKIGRIMRNKRSQSMSGMLLPKDGDGESDRGRCESDWILESTVWT